MKQLQILLIPALALAGCDRPSPAPAPEPTASVTPKSIFRPEFQAEAEPEEQRLQPLAVRILFPEGIELTEDAVEQLTKAVASQQFEEGSAIVLRGHSDAGGSDTANLRISRERAEAVRDWLTENGTAEERITVIAFGEQNPVAPNAKPDGTPNDDGRAKNRRVDIVIAVPAAPLQEPSLAETLAEEPNDEGATE